jgi:hypothetical protein
VLTRRGLHLFDDAKVLCCCVVCVMVWVFAYTGSDSGWPVCEWRRDQVRVKDHALCVCV